MMNLKKTWNETYGKSELVTKENGSLRMVEIDMIRLRPRSAPQGYGL